MAVTIIHELDRREKERLSVLDPFQLSAPCWRVRIELPPVTVTTVVKLSPVDEVKKLITKEIGKLMAIRTVEATKAPARLFVRGGISSKADYVELLAALSNAKPDQAFIVDMDPKAWVKEDGVTPLDKPEVIFAGSLRRRFEASALPIIAYMSGKLQVTVRRLTALEQKEKAAGKGKRKK
jgi:hypothetical protein